jgi:rsbT co-antagonist protein RsbR
VRDTAGQVSGIAAIVRDVSERKQQEAELHIFKTVFENMPDAVGITNTEGIITHSNPAHQRLFGYGEDTIGLQIGDTVAPESTTMLSDVLGEITQQGYWTGESINRDKTGRVFPVDTTVFALRDVQGHMYGMAGVVRDISERKQQEADLKLFKVMADTAPDGFGIAAQDGTLTYANTAYKALTGYGDALVGMNFTDHFAANERAQALDAIKGALMENEWRGVLEFLHKDGIKVPVDTTGFIIRDADGNFTAMIGLFRDLTEQRRAEAEREMLQQQIIDAQRSALRELSTPLIPISNEVVIMPLIGTIDSGRAQQVLETLLEGVAQYQASLAILDITGVSIVDTQVAQSLVSAAQAVRLLGAQVMLTGIQPQIAQTLVHLGVDLGTIVTQGSLQAGIAAALRQA